MKIKELAPDVIKKLRSDVAFTSIAHCVQELVWNSIDAGATCIAVRLNLPLYKIQVVDNGSGISADQLSLVGTRYATSKCHTIEDLKCLQYTGFRGEALASLKNICMNLMIESRAGESQDTYCKIFTMGKALNVKISLNPRPSKGTTITVFDFMYNRPVRKKAISEVLDLEESRKLLQGIALIHPEISFSLHCEAKGETVLQFRKCSSLSSAFMQLFGREKGKNLKLIHNKLDEYELDGYISTDCFPTKELQFLYINKHPIFRTSLHKLINNILSKYLCGKHKSKYDPLNFTPDGLSPSKNQSQYCSFVINIICSRDKYDMIFDRKKTVIEFSEWERISSLTETSMLNFLKAENLMENSVSEKEIHDKVYTNQKEPTLNLGMDNYKSGLFSHAAKRQTIPENQQLLSDKHTLVNNDPKIVHTETSLLLLENNEPTLTSQSHCWKQKSKFDNLVQVGMEQDSSESSNKKLICLKSGICNETSIFDEFIAAKDVEMETISSDKLVNSITTSKCTPKTPLKADIPCRSVFPTKCPIMLRVPTKSNLSIFEKKNASSTAMIKLKEKYKFVPQKLNIKSTLSQVPFPNCAEKIVNDKLLTKQNKKIDKGVQASNDSETRFDASSGILNEVNKPTSSESLHFNKCCNKIVSKYTFCEVPTSSLLKRLRRSNVYPEKISKSLSEVARNSKDMLNESRTFESTSVEPVSHIISRKNSFADSKNIMVDVTLHSENKNIDNELVNSSQYMLSRCVTSHKRNSETLNHDSHHLSSVVSENACSHNHGNADFRTEASNLFVSTFIDEIETMSPNKVQKLDTVDAASLKSQKGKNSVPISGISLSNKKDMSCSNTPFFSPPFSKNEFNFTEMNIDLNTYLDCANSVHMEDSRNMSTKIGIKSFDNRSESIQSPVNCSTTSTENSINDVENNIPKRLENIHNEDQFLPSNVLKTSHTKMNINIFIPNENGNQNISYENVIDSNIEKVTDAKGNLPFHINSGIQQFQISPLSPIIEQSPESRSNLSLSRMNIPASIEITSEHLQCYHCKLDNNVVSVPSPKVSVPYLKDSEITTENSRSVMDLNHYTSDEIFTEKDVDFDISKNREITSTSPNLKLTSQSKVALTTTNENMFNNTSLNHNTSNEIFSENNVDFDSSKSNENVSTSNIMQNLKLTSPDKVVTTISDVNASNITNVNILNNATTGLYSSSNTTSNVNTSNNTTDNGNMLNNTTNMCTSNKDLDSIEQNNLNLIDANEISSLNEHNLFNNNKGRWICQLDRDTKRVGYIDTLTGNSTHLTPQFLQESSNEKIEFVNDAGEKHHFFLTHDFSPFVKDLSTELSKNQLCEEFNALQSHLKNYMNEKDRNDWQRKWRYPREDDFCDDGIQELFNKWENPMFEIPSEINEIVDSNLSRLPHVYTINSYRFTKSTLKSLKVIGQVDCKFIACILEDFNENCKEQRLLALFDQHAVHERIRLEELIEDLYEISENGKRIVKSVMISTPLEISLEADEMRLLKSYHLQLREIGIQLSFRDDATIEVYSIPSCLVDSNNNQLRRRLSEVIVVIERSIKEWLSSLTQSRSVSCILPKSLSGVLNAQACRGAVKFGDPLDLATCEQLLSSLSECKLPFQCAHGRPSIAPILDLNKIETITKKRSYPNISKLRNECETVSDEI